MLGKFILNTAIIGISSMEAIHHKIKLFMKCFKDGQVKKINSMLIMPESKSSLRMLKKFIKILQLTKLILSMSILGIAFKVSV